MEINEIHTRKENLEQSAISSPGICLLPSLFHQRIVICSRAKTSPKIICFLPIVFGKAQLRLFHYIYTYIYMFVYVFDK